MDGVQSSVQEEEPETAVCSDGGCSGGGRSSGEIAVSTGETVNEQKAAIGGEGSSEEVVGSSEEVGGIAGEASSEGSADEPDEQAEHLGVKGVLRCFSEFLISISLKKSGLVGCFFVEAASCLAFEEGVFDLAATGAGESNGPPLGRRRISAEPCANWHLRPYGHSPSFSKFAHSTVL